MHLPSDLLCLFIACYKVVASTIKNSVYLFIYCLRGVQDLSSLTRDQTHAPCKWKCGVLTTPGKSPSQDFTWFLASVYLFSLLMRCVCNTQGKPQHSSHRFRPCLPVNVS